MKRIDKLIESYEKVSGLKNTNILTTIESEDRPFEYDLIFDKDKLRLLINNNLSIGMLIKLFDDCYNIDIEKSGESNDFMAGSLYEYHKNNCLKNLEERNYKNDKQLMKEFLNKNKHIYLSAYECLYLTEQEKIETIFTECIDEVLNLIQREIDKLTHYKMFKNI